MKNTISVFTSESVGEGHPDKLCDQISDAVLDACLQDDPMSRVACESFASTALVLIGGEITTNTFVDVTQIARTIARNIGYTDAAFGLDCDSMAVLNMIHSQSPDIAQGVSGNGLQEFRGKIGAGDQGMMFGFACKETPELMPAPIMYAHRLLERAAVVRKQKKLPWLRPDAKAQVTVKYEDTRPIGIDTVVLSHQHSPDVLHADLTEGIIHEIILPVLQPTGLLTDETNFFINPTGRFVIGGPFGDTGLTGRKIIVDTYGGMGRHGGGAFSGKDPTKVDRSAAYMARYIAKHVIAADLAERCEIQLAYAIGVPYPVSVRVDTFGTGVLPAPKIEKAITDVFDLSPEGIITTLDLRRPIYQDTAVYGHFGRAQFPWEQTDKIRALQTAAGSSS